MINTIFYYPESLTFEEYKNNLNANLIADRTIVFAEDQASIYKGGVEYGLSIDNLKNKLELVFNENPYILPIASATRLGAIKIGKGLSVDSSTEAVSIDFSGWDNQNGYNGLDGLIKTIFSNTTDLRTSTTLYGIVKVAPNGGIAVNNGVISLDISSLPSSQLQVLDYSIAQMSVSGTTLSITQNNNSRSLTVSLPVNSITYGNTPGTACEGNDTRLSDARQASDVYSWAKEQNKPSYAYSEISYAVNTSSSTGGTLSLNGTTPLHVITLTGNVSSLTLSTNPSDGHSCHVILTSASSKTVTITHDATNRVCPMAENVLLTIPAGGYIEINFLSANGKVYVRGV